MSFFIVCFHPMRTSVRGRNGGGRKGVRNRFPTLLRRLALVGPRREAIAPAGRRQEKRFLTLFLTPFCSLWIYVSSELTTAC